MAKEKTDFKLPRYLKEENPISLDVYGVISDTLDSLYQELFKTDSEVVLKQIEILERVENDDDRGKGFKS